MMHPEGKASDFTPDADGFNYDITFCIDEEADMPVNIGTPIKYNRVKIDDDSSGVYSPEQRAALKAMVTKTYPYVSIDSMLKAMKAAGADVSAYCGPEEVLAGFQAAIYTITNPLDGNEKWGYVDSSIAHANYEVNRSTGYVANPDTAAKDIAAVRDYLLGFTVQAQNYSAVALSDEGTAAETASPTPYELVDFNVVVDENDDGTYSVKINNVTLNQPVRAAEGDVVKLWLYYVDENGNVAADNQKCVEIASGEKEGSIELDNIPAGMEYVFAISYLMMDSDVYLYYPDEWEEAPYQPQIGYSTFVSYSEVFHSSTSIPVEKVWEDDYADHNTIKVDLIDTDTNDVVGTIELQGEDWKGSFNHVPFESWSHSEYSLTGGDNAPLIKTDVDESTEKIECNPDYVIGKPENAGTKTPLAEHGYEVKEQPVKGYTSESAQNDEGVWVITNTPKGGLTVTKIVTDPADEGMEFTFTLTLDDSTVNGVYGDMTFKNGVATFTLTHNQSKTAIGLPDGVGFEVEELMPAGDFSHEVTWTVDGKEAAKGWKVSASGTVVDDNTEVKAVATNEKIELGGLVVTNEIDETYKDVVDMEKEFVITVDFFEGDLDGNGEYTESDRGVAGTISGVFNITRNDGTKETIEVVNGRAQIRMKHKESVTIDDLPAGLHYVISEEKDPDGEYTGMDKNTGDVLTSDESAGISGTIPAGSYATEDIVNVRVSTLEVSKTVTGRGGDETFEFEFTLTLDNKINGKYGDVVFTDGVATFTLHHGETKKVEDLAVGTGYTVTEKSYDNYYATYSGRVGTILEGGSKVEVENKYIKPASSLPSVPSAPAPGNPPATGDDSNIALWIGLLAASALCLVAYFILSKKGLLQKKGGKKNKN